MNKEPKRKILFILPSMAGGGAERVFLNILHLIGPNNYEIHLYLGRKSGVLLKELPKQVLVKEIFPNSFMEKFASYSLRWFRSDFILKYFGKKISGYYDVGIVYLDSIYTEFLNISAAKFNKKITFLHSSYKSYGNRLKFIKGRYKKRMILRYQQMNEIIAVSHDIRSEFLDLFGYNLDVKVIYNPLNIKRIINASIEEPEFITGTEQFSLVAVGSLIPVKGFDLLIEALGKFKSYNYKLYILGEGYLREDLNKRIVELDIENKINLCGFCSNPYKEIAKADVLIMSSVTEGLPTVLCEAIILGKPVLVPDVPGCREVIENGIYGIMYNRNVENLALALKKIFDNPDILNKYEQLAKEKSRDFNDEVIIKQYKELLALN